MICQGSCIGSGLGKCEAGNEFIEAFTQENFEAGMQFWEASMNHYLETGKKLIKS